MLKTSPRLKIHDSFAAIWFAAFNTATFLVFGFDKWSAQRSGWRVSESILVMFGALGGWPGGIVGHDCVPAQDRQVDIQVQICSRADSFHCRNFGLASLALTIQATSIKNKHLTAKRSGVCKIL